MQKSPLCPTRKWGLLLFNFNTKRILEEMQLQFTRNLFKCQVKKESPYLP